MRLRDEEEEDTRRLDPSRNPPGGHADPAAPGSFIRTASPPPVVNPYEELGPRLYADAGTVKRNIITGALIIGGIGLMAAVLR